MNAQEAQSYLEELLPGFTITIHEYWKQKPNNRYVFSRDGVDAAMLFGQKLRMTKEILNDVAGAVKKRFNSAEAIEKKLDAEEKKAEPVIQTNNVETREDSVDAKPSELELSFYEAAKKVVADFERKYPMT